MNADALERYYRSFLKVPFKNALLKTGGRKRKRKYHRGGKVTRFGSVLSGEPNHRYLFGAPTGGAEGIVTPIRGPEFLGGKRRSHRKYRGRGYDSLMNEYINPLRGYGHTWPQIGSLSF